MRDDFAPETTILKRIRLADDPATFFVFVFSFFRLISRFPGNAGGAIGLVWVF